MTVIQIGNAFARASAVSVLQTVKIVNSKNIFGCTVCVNNRLILILLVSLFVKGAIPIYLILSSPGPNLSYLCHFCVTCLHFCVTFLHLFALLCHCFALCCTLVSLFILFVSICIAKNYLICVTVLHFCVTLLHYFALLCHLFALWCTFVSICTAKIYLICVTVLHFCVTFFALLCHFFALLILFVMKSDETSAFCIFYLFCVKKVQK